MVLRKQNPGFKASLLRFSSNLHRVIWLLSTHNSRIHSIALTQIAIIMYFCTMLSAIIYHPDHIEYSYNADYRLLQIVYNTELFNLLTYTTKINPNYVFALVMIIHIALIIIYLVMGGFLNQIKRINSIIFEGVCIVIGLIQDTYIWIIFFPSLKSTLYCLLTSSGSIIYIIAGILNLFLMAAWQYILYFSRVNKDFIPRDQMANRFTPIIELIIINQLILAFSAIFLSFSLYTITIFCISILYSIYQLYIYIHDLPFYNDQISMIFGIMSGMYAYSIICIGMHQLAFADFTLYTYMIFGLISMWFIMQYIRQKLTIRLLINGNYETLPNARFYYLIKIILGLLKGSDDKSKGFTYMLIIFMKNHVYTCNDMYCECKNAAILRNNITENDNLLEKSYIIVKYKNAIIQILKKSFENKIQAQKHHDMELKLLYVLFLMYYAKKYIKAYTKLTEMRLLLNYFSRRQRYVLYNICEQIERLFEDNIYYNKANKHFDKEMIMDNSNRLFKVNNHHDEKHKNASKIIVKQPGSGSVTSGNNILYKDAIVYSEQLVLLSIKIQNLMKVYLELLRELEMDIVNLNDVTHKSKAILGLKKEILITTNFLNEINPYNTQLKYILMQYYSLQTFDEFNSNKSHKNLYALLDRRRRTNLHLMAVKDASMKLFDENTCIIFANLDDKKLGYIKKTTSSFYKIFGLNPSESKIMNINRIMPRDISLKHDQILKDLKEKDKSLNLSKFIENYAVDGNNFLFPVKIDLRLETFDGELCIAGCVNRPKKIKESMLVMENGYVIGYTSGFKYTIDLYNPKFNSLSQNLHISLIVPLLAMLFMDDEMKLNNLRKFINERGSVIDDFFEMADVNQNPKSNQTIDENKLKGDIQDALVYLVFPINNSFMLQILDKFSKTTGFKTQYDKIDYLKLLIFLEEIYSDYYNESNVNVFQGVINFKTDVYPKSKICLKTLELLYHKGITETSLALIRMRKFLSALRSYYTTVEEHQTHILRLMTNLKELSPYDTEYQDNNNSPLRTGNKSLSNIDYEIKPDAQPKEDPQQKASQLEQANTCRHNSLSCQCNASPRQPESQSQQASPSWYNSPSCQRNTSPRQPEGQSQQASPFRQNTPLPSQDNISPRQHESQLQQSSPFWRMNLLQDTRLCQYKGSFQHICQTLGKEYALDPSKTLQRRKALGKSRFESISFHRSHHDDDDGGGDGDGEGNVESDIEESGRVLEGSKVDVHELAKTFKDPKRLGSLICKAKSSNMAFMEQFGAQGAFSGENGQGTCDTRYRHHPYDQFSTTDRGYNHGRLSSFNKRYGHGYEHGPKVNEVFPTESEFSRQANVVVTFSEEPINGGAEGNNSYWHAEKHKKPQNRSIFYTTGQTTRSKSNRNMANDSNTACFHEGQINTNDRLILTSDRVPSSIDIFEGYGGSLIDPTSKNNIFSTIFKRLNGDEKEIIPELIQDNLSAENSRIDENEKGKIILAHSKIIEDNNHPSHDNESHSKDNKQIETHLGIQQKKSDYKPSAKEDNLEISDDRSSPNFKENLRTKRYKDFNVSTLFCSRTTNPKAMSEVNKENAKRSPRKKKMKLRDTRYLARNQLSSASSNRSVIPLGYKKQKLFKKVENDSEATNKEDIILAANEINSSNNSSQNSSYLHFKKLLGDKVSIRSVHFLDKFSLMALVLLGGIITLIYVFLLNYLKTDMTYAENTYFPMIIANAMGIYGANIELRLMYEKGLLTTANTSNLNYPSMLTKSLSLMSTANNQLQVFYGNALYTDTIFDNANGYIDYINYRYNLTLDESSSLADAEDSSTTTTTTTATTSGSTATTATSGSNYTILSFISGTNLLLEYLDNILYYSNIIAPNETDTSIHNSHNTYYFRSNFHDYFTNVNKLSLKVINKIRGMNFTTTIKMFAIDILIVCLLLTLAFIMPIYPIYRNVEKRKEKCLSLLTTFSLNDIEMLMTECENIYNALEMNQSESINDLNKPISKQMQKKIKSDTKRKKNIRDWKINKLHPLIFITFLLCLFSILSIYFIIFSTKIRSHNDNYMDFITELNFASKLPACLTANYYILYFGFNLLNQTSPYYHDIYLTQFNSIETLCQESLIETKNFWTTLDSFIDYNTDITEYYRSTHYLFKTTNICEIVLKDMSKNNMSNLTQVEECSLALEQAATFGLENFIYALQNKFNNMKNNLVWSNFSSATIQGFISKPDFQGFDSLLYYGNLIFNSYLDTLSTNLNNILNSQIAEAHIFFICGLIVLCIVYLALHFGFIKHINQEFVKAKLIYNIFPVKLIYNNKYIKKWLVDNSHHPY